jgi:hypothetical protein
MAYKYPRWKKWFSASRALLLCLAVLLGGIYYSIYIQKRALFLSMQQNEHELARVNGRLKTELAELSDLKLRLKNEDEETILVRARQLGLGKKNEIFTLDKETLKTPSIEPETATAASEKSGGKPWLNSLLEKLPFGRDQEKSH